MDFLSKLKRNHTVAVILMLLFGIALLLEPIMLIDIIGYVLGGVLALAGILVIIRYFFEKNIDFAMRYNLLIGLILTAAGITLMLNNAGIVGFVVKIFAIIILFHAIVDFQQAVHMHKYGYERWWIAMLIALVALAAGIVLLLIKIEQGTAIAGRIAGAVLLYDAITDIWISARISKLLK